LGNFVVVVTIAVAPQRRGYDYHPTPRCFTSLASRCTQPVRDEYGDNTLEKLRNTDLREPCG